MDNQTRYRICSARDYLPLCFQPWWLDAVCGPDGWGAVLADEPDDPIRVVWPWYRTRRLGIPVVVPPPFTSYGGPWIFGQSGESTHKYTAQYPIVSRLAARLPKVWFFRQNLHPDTALRLPLHWVGFRETTRYSYRLDPSSGLENLWRDFSPALRGHLRKAEMAVEIRRQDAAADVLWALNAASWRRHGLPQPQRFQVFKRLHGALQQRGCSALWLALCRATGAPWAALYVAYDGRTAGALISGAAPGGRPFAALPALYWEALQFAVQKNIQFDFEGSMHAGIERAFRSFNGRLTPYGQIQRPG
jgi:hypothetical protein